MRARVGVLAFGVLVATLWGCAGSPSSPGFGASVTFVPASNSSAGTDTPTPSATTSDQSQAPDATAVTVGCELLTKDEVSAAVGVDIEKVEEGTDIPGGFGCVWSTPPGQAQPPRVVSLDVDPNNIAAARANLSTVAVEPEPGAGAKEAFWGPLNVLVIITDEHVVTLHVLYPGGDARKATLMLSPLVMKRLEP